MRKVAAALLSGFLLLSTCACSGSTVSDGAVSEMSPGGAVDVSTSSSVSATRSTTSMRAPNSKPTSSTTAPVQNTPTGVKTVLVGKEGENNVIYQLNEGGLVVREVIINAGRGGEAVEIVQITDAHVAFRLNERMNWQTCLDYAKDYDYTVATGDLIEGLHTDLTQWMKNSLSDNPNTMLLLGNHEWNPTKGTPEAMADRYALLQEYWPNDVVYSSTVVKNKVMLIGLDNSQSQFHAEQIPKLQADLKTARDKGYAVLLFYHIPLRTENPEEKSVKALLPMDPKQIHSYNFYSSQLRGKDNDATAQVYDIITNNADVIKGTFCGHLHEDIYTEIVAKTASGQDAVIPQHINHAGRYGAGHVLKITVK